MTNAIIQYVMYIKVNLSPKLLLKNKNNQRGKNMKRILKYLPILLIVSFLSFSHFAKAEDTNLGTLTEIENNDKEKYDHITISVEENRDTKKEYSYSFKYNYDEIYELLKLTEKEYDTYWKDGLSISDMAKEQGIDRDVLMEYFVTFHHDVLRKWLVRDNVPEHLYFTQVYRLKDVIIEFIERNPNK